MIVIESNVVFSKKPKISIFIFSKNYFDFFLKELFSKNYFDIYFLN